MTVEDQEGDNAQWVDVLLAEADLDGDGSVCFDKFCDLLEGYGNSVAAVASASGDSRPRGGE